MQRATQPPSLRNEELVRRWESAYGWIDVTRDDSDTWSVRQNLHYRHGASGETAMAERRQALVPLLLHRDPRHVLFLGLGTGVTVSGALPFSNVESITAVELIPQVVEAAHFLSEFNHGVTSDPRVTVRVDDARHDLLAHNGKYDVIVSDLFVPWESHTGYLYTVEHYRTVRNRLRNGGLFCQWLPLYQLGKHEFEAIANSFATVFPETTLWWGQLDPRWPVIGLIGTEQPMELGERSLDIRCSRLSQSAMYSGEPILSGARLLSHAVGTWPIPGADDLLNTDEYPIVEFRSPFSRVNNRLLRAGRLLHYRDTMLATLPDPTNSKSTATEDRSWQRWLLFGEPTGASADAGTKR